MKATGLRHDGSAFSLTGEYISSTQHQDFTNLVAADSKEDIRKGKIIAGVHGAVQFIISEDQE